MKFQTQIPCLVLIIFNIFKNTSAERLTEAHCDIEADEANIQWFSQVYKTAHNNQNITEDLKQIEEKLNRIETKLDRCQKDLLHLQSSQCNENNQELVIQRRQDGSENFYRTWDEYKQGFGNSSGEFFIGLEKLHKLTNTRPYQLFIVMEDWENQRRYAKYDQFVIGSETEQYKLVSLGTYTGTAGDSLAYHLGLKFTTKDHDNDESTDSNCAIQYKGAWWHKKCHYSNLNGSYLKGTIGGAEWAQGVIWQAFKDYTYSLKFVEMILIRS